MKYSAGKHAGPCLTQVKSTGKKIRHQNNLYFWRQASENDKSVSVLLFYILNLLQCNKSRLYFMFAYYKVTG